PTYCKAYATGRRLDAPGGARLYSGRVCDPKSLELSILKTIFTWWNGATTGIHFTTWRRGRLVGTDELGNRYYEARDDRDSYDRGRKRRWVIYNGYADASKVTPDWHGWLRYTFDEPPTSAPLPRR